MITDDPIRDLERQLVRAAATLGRQTPAPAARHRRRQAALAVTAVVIAAVGAVIGLGARDSSRFSIARAAAAQLSPSGNRIVHLRYTSTFYNGRRVTQRVLLSTWYSETVTRTVATTLTPRGRTIATLETVRTPEQLRSYESSQNVMTLQATCRHGSREFTDPIATLRQLLSQGRLTQAGEQRFDGIAVKRLRTTRGPLNIVFLVRKSDGAPVAMTTDVGGGVDRTVARFTAHETMPDTPSAEQHLALAPHPTSRVVRLRAACP